MGTTGKNEGKWLMVELIRKRRKVSRLRSLIRAAGGGNRNEVQKWYQLAQGEENPGLTVLRNEVRSWEEVWAHQHSHTFLVWLVSKFQTES